MSVLPAPKGSDVPAYRAWYRQNVRPKPYFRWMHAGVHQVAVIGAVGYALAQVHDLRPLQWLAVAAGPVYGSLFVYWFHRHILHRRVPGFDFAYRKHTLQHHRFFTHEYLTRDEPDDLHAMLFPWWSGIPLVALSYGTARALLPAVGANVAYLTMSVMVGYFGLYEFVHTVNHLPDGHPLTRVPVLAFLREHHRLHHDPSLMGKYNFNVVFPLFDWVFGALITKRDRVHPR